MLEETFGDDCVNEASQLLDRNLFKAKRFSKTVLARAVFVPALLFLLSKFKGSSRTIRSISQSSDLVTFQIILQSLLFFQAFRDGWAEGYEGPGSFT